MAVGNWICEKGVVKIPMSLTALFSYLQEIQIHLQNALIVSFSFEEINYQVSGLTNSLQEIQLALLCRSWISGLEPLLADHRHVTLTIWPAWNAMQCKWMLIRSSLWRQRHASWQGSMSSKLQSVWSDKGWTCMGTVNYVHHMRMSLFSTPTTVSVLQSLCTFDW